jgi:vitamin B12 transporter
MRHVLIRAAVLAAGSFAITPALAQESEEEIVITASRTPTPRTSLPADVVVIDAAEARARGAFTLDAALADTPGLQAPRTGPVGQQASIFSAGFESNHTLVLFDGVRLDDPSTPEGVFDAGQDLLGDAERIEVVRGPMSALYGSGALGGVVNVLARRGGEGAFNPRLELAGGSFGTLAGLAGVDGALGGLRYAITAESFVTDGYDIVPERIAAHTGERDGAKTATVTGVFDVTVNQGLAFDLLVRRREASAEYDPGLFGNIDENPEAEIRQNDLTLWRAGATWAPNNAFSLRLSGGALETARVTADAGVVGDTYRGDRVFGDIVATWRSNRWTLLLGGQGEDEEIDAVSFGSAVIGAQSHWGFFAAAQGALGSVDLTAAARHDDYEGFGGRHTWRAGAAYPIGNRARLYAAYGTSYRAPSLYERYVPFFGAAGLDPERAKSLEIGGEASLALFGRSDGLELRALYRSSEIDDLIGFFGFTYANIDRAEIDHAETRITLRPFDWLTARLAYANTDARDAQSGAALLRRPRHAWTAAVATAHGPFSAELSWRRVGARQDILYDDLGFFAGAGRAEAYELVRASASWAASASVSVYVAADNALDELHEPVNGFAGAPANVTIGLRITP